MLERYRGKQNQESVPRVGSEPIDLGVRIYDPTNQEDQERLRLSLQNTLYPQRRFRIKRSRNFEVLLKESEKKGIYFDAYPEFLRDQAKRALGEGKGKPYYAKYPRKLERYIDINNKFKNTRIIEYTEELGSKKFVRFPVEDDLDEVVFSGNGKIITDDDRAILRERHVAFAGAGVGSSLFEEALKAGIKNATIADGGSISFHDQGRAPAPDLREVTERHAEVAAKRALKFNPYLNIRCFPKNIGLTDTDTTVSIDTFLKDADIVFEEIDNLLMKILIREEARRRGIPVVMITDVGMGTIVDYQPGDYKGDIFPGLSRRLYNRAKSGKVKNLKEATKIAIQMVGPEVRYWRDDIKRHPYWSQTSAAASASQSKTADFLIKWVRNEKIPYKKAYGVERPKLLPLVIFNTKAARGRRRHQVQHEIAAAA